jgi:uncharacterized membrane-anchored protein YhcB (DUF1043 family)
MTKREISYSHSDWFKRFIATVVGFAVLGLLIGLITGACLLLLSNQIIKQQSSDVSETSTGDEWWVVQGSNL